MEHRSLQLLVETNIKNFINEYESAPSLFEKSEVKNNLIHPGEYGLYKEQLVKDLFKFALPQKYSCGNGFIINSIDEITTQCDIIIYDELRTPFLKNDDSNRFFPQEAVYGIGEIKSKLTTRQLCEAMVKLANNKKIRKPFVDEHNKEVNPDKRGYDGLFTFLICDEVIDWNNDIALQIQKEYIKHAINPAHWFNLFISLKNGVIAYDVFRAVKILEAAGISVDEKLEENGGHSYIALPYFTEGISLDFKTITLNDKVKHVKEFLVLMNEVLVHTQSYYPDPKYYLY